MNNQRFIVSSMTITQDWPPPVTIENWDGTTSGLAAGKPTTCIDISLILHDEKAVADLARIPEFAAMLGREMDRLGLCRYCGCQLPNDDKPNCSQCAGPRIDRA